MNGSSSRNIFIDPSSVAYYGDRLFDRDNLILNRDDTLEPFIRLREFQHRLGNIVHTADHLLARQSDGRVAEYYSLGVLDNYRALARRTDVRLRAFVIFEPPVVDPRLYGQLSELTKAFETVYVHNTAGDGYSLSGVNQHKLRKLNWPQPRADVIDTFWMRDERANRIVVINGSHRPKSSHAELYSRRIQAMAALARSGAIDLYGRGWDKWWSRSSMWLPYWINRSVLMSIYKGPCDSKFDVLSRYRFCLCFENMEIQGYVTEKIFDCFYAGTIPLYLGATDISDLIPTGSYIDCRTFSSWDELRESTLSMTEDQVLGMKNAGRTFLRSESYLKYFNSLMPIFSA